MEQLNFKLETFEGPLDLLLTLIEKHKIDIYDIQISVLAEQYMEYISVAEKYNISLAADFLEMASHLMYIKSCMLLPKAEDEEDPKAVLEAMLLEYSKYKKVAAELKNRYIGNLLFFRETIPAGLPTIYSEPKPDPSPVVRAYNNVLLRNERKKPVPMSAFRRLVGTKFVSVSSRIVSVMKSLFRSGRTSFRSLFKGCGGRPEIIATFLAVLELLRHGRVDIDGCDEKGEVVLSREKSQKQETETQWT